MSPTSRANPLAGNPLRSRDDVATAVRDLYEPLVAHTSDGGARVRLGSFAAVFEESTAELEGYARPLYGIVPLAVGGGEFGHWDRFAAGLDAGTDPSSPEYWGHVPGNADQRMVEQAAVGLALAFCPERIWNPLSSDARRRVVSWLTGIFDHDPVANNWQFFRVLVSLGLQRVGAGYDATKVTESLDLLAGYGVGRHWFRDGVLGNVDYYVPFAFQTYGLMYAAANDLGLGDDARASRFREQAASFAADFQHWFAPDGAAIPFGRSLTYRFAMSSFWSALAWADVESDLSWGQVKGLLLRNLRWWSQQPISDRDGVLSVGYAYDNRRLAESYNSAGSPYWCMKAFGALAAPADHPFWTSEEEPLEPLAAPVTLPDAGQVLARTTEQALLLPAHAAPKVDMPEQSSGKYRKFAYSSTFGFSGDIADFVGSVFTDSMLALTDLDGNRRVRLGADAAGVEDAMTWSTWHPWPDVRIDSVCWAIDGATHGRLHRVRTSRALVAFESGFAIGLDTPTDLADGAKDTSEHHIAVTTSHGTSSVADLRDGSSVARRPVARNLAVNATVVHPRTAVPALLADLSAGDHRLATLVHATPTPSAAILEPTSVPDGAARLLDRIAAEEIA